MKLINSSVEYIPQEESTEGMYRGLENIYKQIERCARTCYKSEDKITDSSSKAFVDRLIASKHTAMLEHGTVYLQCKIYLNEKDDTPLSKYKNNKYSKCSEYYFPGSASRGTYVVTNLRVLVENNWLDDLQYLCSPTEFHEKRYTFKFTCSRAIANELVRHRVFSFAQESSRYCNYSKDKFGNEITFIEPSWKNKVVFDANLHLYNTLYAAEVSYFDLLKNDATPQQARDVLPLATKTELCMTGFASDWRYLLDARLYEKTGKVHPDMLDLMEKLKTVAEEADIWDDIMSKPSKFK